VSGAVGRLAPGRGLEVAFELARQEGRAALIPFLTAGDPAIELTPDILEALVAGGADVIELGVPFSDPVADGPVIQASSQRALDRGVRLGDVLEVVSRFTERFATPVILFGYYNPVLRVGEAEYARRAREAGAAGALVVDLGFEESGGLRGALGDEGLHLVSLVSPTTPASRAAEIARAASGFVYYVSMTGVTGRQLHHFDAVQRRVAELRELTEVPVAVGFGVRTGDDVAQVAAFADGVVVGSELVRRIAGASPAGAARAARQYVAELRERTKK
jgi:tryptophan synthase alpha chain